MCGFPFRGRRNSDKFLTIYIFCVHKKNLFFFLMSWNIMDLSLNSISVQYYYILHVNNLSVYVIIVKNLFFCGFLYSLYNVVHKPVILVFNQKMCDSDNLELGGSI